MKIKYPINKFILWLKLSNKFDSHNDPLLVPWLLYHFYKDTTWSLPCCQSCKMSFYKSAKKCDGNTKIAFINAGIFMKSGVSICKNWTMLRNDNRIAPKGLTE